MQPDDPRPQQDGASEIGTLAFRYFDGLLDSDETAKLNELLRSSEAARERFIDYALERFVLREILVASQNEEDARSLLDGLMELEAQSPPTGPIDITTLLAQREQRLAEARRTPPAVPASDTLPTPRVIVIPKFLVYALGTAVAASLGLMIYFGFLAGRGGEGAPTDQHIAVVQEEQPPIVVGTLVSSDDAAWAGDLAPAEGGQVVDRGYRLVAGAATLRLDGGALVRIEAPAAFRLSAADRMTLNAGRLVGYCDDRARGFTVETANARFTDLGTEFGVIVEPGRTSQLHVFTGVVEATVTGAGAVSEQPTWVTANQAARIDAGAATPTPMTADRSAFETTRLRPLALRNAGAGLSADKPLDPDWLLVAVDGVDLMRPRRAEWFDLDSLQSEIRDRYLPNHAGKSQWITTPLDEVTQIGRRFSFERTLDFTGIDPDTLELTLGMIADNFITSVLLNGRPVFELEEEPVIGFGQTFTQFQLLTITDGFRPGINTLRVEIGNPEPLATRKNYTALRIELSGVGQPAWRDAGEETSGFRP